MVKLTKFVAFVGQSAERELNVPAEIYRWVKANIKYAFTGKRTNIYSIPGRPSKQNKQHFYGDAEHIARDLRCIFADVIKQWAIESVGIERAQKGEGPHLSLEYTYALLNHLGISPPRVGHKNKNPNRDNTINVARRNQTITPPGIPLTKVG